MTVAELIALLLKQPQDAEVHIVYNYGDHSRTEVAPAITTVEELHLEYSEYHQMHAAREGDEDTEQEDLEANAVCIY